MANIKNPRKSLVLRNGQPKAKLIFMPARSCVVGIAGGSAAGKTSLALALKHFIEQTSSQQAELLHLDDFFRDKTGEPTFVSPSDGEKRFNFNHPGALDQERLLGCIRSRCTAEEAPDILFVEGLMVLQILPVRETLDVRVFVELEADVRALRRLLRDMKGGRAKTNPEWIATYYLESARAGHDLFVEPSRVHADLIVRGDADFSRVVPLLAATILSKSTGTQG